VTRLQPILHKHRSLLGHVVFAVTAIVAVGLVADARDRFGYVLGVVLATVAVMTVPWSESERKSEFWMDEDGTHWREPSE
jgi:hypothetical protein